MKDSVKYFTHTKTLIFLAVVFILSLGYVQVKHSQEIAMAPQQIIETPSPTVAVPTKTVAKTPVLDINGTYECKYGSISAVIDKRRAFVESRTATTSSYMVYRDDCLYMWNKKSYKGSKQCGLDQYISMLETASSTGLFGMDSVLHTLLDSNFLSGMMGKSSPVYTIGGSSKKNVTSLANSCVSVTTVDQSSFTLPRGVVFSEAK